MKYDGNKPIGLSELVESYPELVKEHADKVSKTDYATSSYAGVIKIGAGLNIDDNGKLLINGAGTSSMKAGTTDTSVITPWGQHISTFYGLAKAAGDTTQASSSNAVGTYTDGAKSAIRSMLGAIGNTDYASSSTAGVVKVNTGYGIGILGTGEIGLVTPNGATIKAGATTNAAISPARQHYAAFYGLAKAAGADEAETQLTFGTYSDTAKTAIRTMLGAVGTTDYATSSTGGTVKVNSNYGLSIDSGTIKVSAAGSASVKSGQNANVPIAPSNQHESVFYGLAKIAGSDERNSSLAAGTYTDAAKTAIQAMLGVESGVAFVEDISGTTPSIAGEANTRYMCGEVTSISITPPSTGIIDVMFTSGSTPAVLTVTPPTGMTMMWPAWFDSTSLATNTIYEINIMNGKYGAVMAW